ncbi:hypothetical protein D9758_006010 [Tetrapyrgos nigripes]|uniref:Uncharacterized protein n=1 Tax=Tetrapyrgos nigripes TaxID=182062 RepID=A0A8H5G0E7_9AGAR|nr:hypothetical protein D9758_006010 [Tetrapyrgos nigripes]
MASQNRPSMPSSVHTTVDEDDDDICPVCDGDCTCHSYHPRPSPQQRPVLKIKLPPKPQTTSVVALGGAAPPPPKRRGRPPKNPNAAASSSTYRRPKPSATNRRPPPPPKKSSTKKKAAPKRKRVESSDSSDLTDVETIDDLEPPSQFPTFLPASALPSIASTSSADEDSDSSSSCSDFDTDSDIEAEEESFIVAQEERARNPSKNVETIETTTGLYAHAKNSVGAPSDVDMDVDSDATEDDDEEDEDEEEDDDEEDDEDGMDSSAADPFPYPGLATSWSDEEEEDEESSFDADLFFANLSDSEHGSSDLDGSSTQSDDAAQDGDQSDLEGIAASIIPHLRQQGMINLPFEVAEGWDGQVVFTNGTAETGLGYLDASDFDVIAPPDASASPSAAGDADVDMTSTDPDEEGYEQDVDVDTAEGEGEGDTTDEDLVGDDDLPNERAMRLFNTPFSFSSLSSINPLSTMSPVATSRRRNSSISSVDSPRPADILAGRVSNVIWEDSAEELDRSDEHNEAEDPIEKEKERVERGGMPRRGTFEVAVPNNGKKARQAIIDDQHKVVPSPHPRFKRGIGHGVLGMGRHRTSLSQSSTSSGYQSILQRCAMPLRTSSLPPPSTRFPMSSDLPVSSYNSDVPLAVASSDPADISPSAMPIDLSDVLDPSFLASADSTELYHTEMSLPPPDTPTTCLSGGAGDMSPTETEDPLNQRHMRNLDRWDLISVGAFRKTREAIVVGSPESRYVSDVPVTPGGWSDTDYGNNRYQSVMKASPLTTMLWHNKNGQRLQQMQRSGPFSPELLPVGGSSNDGDRTPTTSDAIGTGSGLQPAFMTPKSKKEMKKERKLKRKNGAGAHTSHRHASHQEQRHQHHHTSKMRQHHNHNHYANTKSRSTGSVQRFFSSPVPSLSI